MDNHPSIPRPAGHYTLQERETMITSTARIESANAPRYLARLCRHFSHKRQVEWTETEGKVEFDMGTCFLEARDSVLTLKAVATTDRKSTRLNSSHVRISYAVFCLKKKTAKRATRY